MLKIINNIDIEMVRGDTGPLEFTFYNGTTVYTPAATDSIEFTAKRNLDDKDVAIYKTATGSPIMLEHNDTEDLEAGTYYYDIQLTTADGKTVATIPDEGCGSLIILPDVTRS